MLKCGLSSLVISPPGLKSRRNLRLVVLMPVFDCIGMSLPACGEGRRLISASRSMYFAQMGARFGSSGPCAEFQRRRDRKSVV